MKYLQMLAKPALVVSCTLASLGTVSAASVTWNNSELHDVSIMMSEPMMRVNGGYHELLDSHYLKPIYGDNKTVMAPLDDIIDELNGIFSIQGDTVTLGLNDQRIEMTVGTLSTRVNGVVVEAPVAPQRIEGAIYLPFRFVFEQLGAKYTWNSKRERAEAILLRPAGSLFKSQKGSISIKTIYKQAPEWFASNEATAVADAMVANQNPDGGWFKLGSSDSLAQVYDRETFPTYRQKSTIDNDATYVQVTTLAKVFSHTQNESYKQSALKGIRYLLDGQLNNGGWPQFFPNPTGYHRHITFNDNAIANTLELLGKVASQQQEFSFVPTAMANQAKAAVQKGVALILDRQVVVNGKKTGWCAQYHFETLACEKGRSYELAAISGGESVNVIKFLMSIEAPSPAVIEAVNSAVAFLHSQTIHDKKMVKVKDVTTEFGQKRVVIDKEGSAMWPRFINLDTLAPLFSNRQGDRLEHFEDVSYERAIKYSWYVTGPGKLIKNHYPKWQQAHSPELNVLK